MAGDTTTELLFIDTFKHQSAEVIYLMHNHPLTTNHRAVCIKSSHHVYLQGLKIDAKLQANDVNIANTGGCVAITFKFTAFILD